MKKEDTSIQLLPFKCILLILPTGLTSVSPIRLAYAQYREQPYLQTTLCITHGSSTVTVY